MNLEFKKLTLSDIPAIRLYWTLSDRRTCDFTTGGTMMWRDFFQIEYAIINDTLIFKLIYFDQIGFTFPIGQDIFGAILAIRRYCNYKGIQTIFCTLTFSDIEILKRYAELRIKEERDWADYIYDADSLSTYVGARYKGQRNHVNFFIKSHPEWTYEYINPNNLLEVMSFYQSYLSLSSYNHALSPIYREESRKTVEVIDNYSKYGLEGALIKIKENKIVGFTIGEIVNDVLYIHIEKADKSYRGAHQLLAKEFIRHNIDKGILYVNREEDVGNLGLRIAKQAYHPINIIEKYTATILYWKTA